MLALPLVSRSNRSVNDARRRMYSAAIRTLSVATPYDARLHACDRHFSWPRLRELQLFHNFACDPEALHDVLECCANGINTYNSSSGDCHDNDGSRSGGGSSMGLVGISFIDHFPYQASVDTAEQQYLRERSIYVNLSEMTSVLAMLSQACPRLESLDLGDMFVCEEIFDFFCLPWAPDANADTERALNRRARKKQKRSRLQQQRLTKAQAAARRRNPFAGLHALGLSMHPSQTKALVSLVQGRSLVALTLRLPGDPNTVADGLRALSPLGTQLRRLLLHMSCYRLKPYTLRPLHALTELHELRISCESYARSAPVGSDENNGSAAAAAATAADEDWHSIATGMPHLRSLSVRMNEVLSPRTFCIVAEHCRQLTALSLEAHCDFGALAEAKSPVFPALQQLRVDGPSETGAVKTYVVHNHLFHVSFTLHFDALAAVLFSCYFQLVRQRALFTAFLAINSALWRLAL